MWFLIFHLLLLLLLLTTYPRQLQQSQNPTIAGEDSYHTWARGKGEGDDAPP